MRRSAPKLYRLLVALALALAGCGGSTHDCTPGAQVACACPDGTSSSQTCAADGSAYGACEACPNVDGGITQTECAKMLPAPGCGMVDGTYCCN